MWIILLCICNDSNMYMWYKFCLNTAKLPHSIVYNEKAFYM